MLLALPLLVTGCAAVEPDALESASQCSQQQPAASGPVLLQEPPQDVPGPFYTGRTDGPCGLLLTFIGAGEGDGPCNVAEYVGRIEPDGDDLRLVVDERHTGEQPTGETVCTLGGHPRQMRVTLDEPLDGRRIVDEQGHLISLVDGDRLLQWGELPEGWTEAQEGQGVAGPVHWSIGLRGPGDVHGELRQGGPELGRQSPGPSGFGYREIGRPQVRGAEAVLASFDAEAPGNHILTWVEDDRGFALQALGPLPDPQVLVDIANGLRVSGAPSGS
jgi:hypothetical protein